MTPPNNRPYWLQFCVACGTFHDASAPCPSQFMIAAVRTLAQSDLLDGDGDAR